MNPAEHLKNLHSLLLRLVEKNVRINGAKCKIAQTSIPFLGFTIHASGIHPNRKCMSAWVESKSPTNFAELRSITSALQYYSGFVPYFAAKADCLFKLQTANSFKWELQHEQCLLSLLNFFATDAVVRPYSTNTQPTLITDASYLDLGVILEQ